MENFDLIFDVFKIGAVYGLAIGFTVHLISLTMAAVLNLINKVI